MCVPVCARVCVCVCERERERERETECVCVTRGGETRSEEILLDPSTHK